MLLPLVLPSGVWRNGTQYQAKGRWYDTNLVRFYESTVRPWGGWVAFGLTAVTGAARAILTWTDSASLSWALVGTHNHLYVFDSGGGLSDITPSGLTAGIADATLAGGYGGSTYGTGTYGGPRSGSTTITPATVWTLDALEQYPVACNAADGKIYSWDLVTAHIAAQCAGSPTSCRGVVVTEEGFIFALGAGGDPRNIQWPDQSSFTAWTPSATNMARAYALQTTGKIMCGRRINGGTVIFCTTDVHLATFGGLPNVYSFTMKGTGCGIISQGAHAGGEDFCAWMSLTGFWRFDGVVTAIESDVGDFVFKNLNMLQRSKITAIHNAAFGEITWFYPSLASTENDSYVTWNYRENHWAIGSLVRTCGIEAGVFANPLMIDASGNVWTHEIGYLYTGGGTPYSETGPIEVSQGYAGPVMGGLHDGTNTFDLMEMRPDSLTLGDATVTFYTSLQALGPETTWGPYPAAVPTNLRVAGRQARMRFTFAATGEERVGIPRLDFRLSGER